MATRASRSRTASVVTVYPVTGQPLSHWPVRPEDRYRVTRVPTDPLVGRGLVPALDRATRIEVTSELAYVGNRLVAHIVSVHGLPDDFAKVVQVTKELFDPDQPLVQNGRQLSLVAGGRPTGTVPKQDSYPHQLVVLPARSAVLNRARVGTGTLARDEALRQLVFKDLDIAYDVHSAPVTTPTDASAPRGMDLVVWDTMTVVEGLESVRDAAFAAGRLAQLVEVNVQVLAARLNASSVRRAVLERIATDSRAGVPQQGEQTRRLEALRELRRRLVNDVNVLISGLAVQGGRPAQSYHRALVSETGIRSDLEATEGLLADLVRIGELDESHQLIRDSTEQAKRTAELLDTSRAIRVVGTVFATVSVGLAASSLFTGIAAVPRDAAATWVGGVPRATVWAVTLTGLVLLLGICLAIAAPLNPTRGRRTALLASAGSTVAAAVCAARLWSVGPDGVSASFTALVACIALAALLLAYGIRFERS